MAFDPGLLNGDVEFPKRPQKQTEDSYDLMRKFSIILLNDIMAGRESRVRREFQKVMKPGDEDEFVEYGSTNKRSIEIQKYGFSRESALYILQHETEYVYKSETQLKLKKSILECPNKGVKADAELAWYNTPELFLEEEA